MKNTIKYLCGFSLLLLVGFMTSCEKENIDQPLPPVEDTLSIDTLLCDLNYDVILGDMLGMPLASVLVSNLSGGTAPYSYIWNTGETTELILTPEDGIYSVTVTDDNNCTLAGSIEVTLNTSLCDSFTLSIQAFDTFPVGTKRLEPTLAGGTGPYNYEWSTGQTNSWGAIEVNVSGTYSVTITDANGCIIEGTFTVNIATDPCANYGVSIFYNPDSLQMGQDYLVSHASGSTGTSTYLWSTGETGGGIEVTGGSGIYSVTATDTNGCTAEDSYEL